MKKQFFTLFIFVLFQELGMGQGYQEKLSELIDKVYSSDFKAEANITHFRYFKPGELSGQNKITVLVDQGKLLDSLQAAKFHYSESRQILFSENGKQKKVISSENTFGSEDYCVAIDNVLEINNGYIKIHNRQFMSPFGRIGAARYSFTIDSSYGGDGVLIRIDPRSKKGFLFSGSVLLSDSLNHLKEINLSSGNCKIASIDSVLISLSFNSNKKNIDIITSQDIKYWANFYDYQSVGIHSTLLENYETENYVLPIQKKNEIMLIDNTQSDYYCSANNMLCCLDTIKRTSIDTMLYNERASFLSEALFKGYYHIQKNRKNTYYFSPLVYFPQFNAYEGWSLDQQVIYKHFFNKDVTIESVGNIRYNLSSNRLLGRSHLTFLMSPKKQFKLLLNVGSYVRQTNQKDPFNLSSWLLYIPESDLSSKVYSNDYVKAGFDSEILNGFYIQPTFEYSRRASIDKTKNYPYAFNPLDKRYIENFGIPSHRYAEFSLELRYTSSQKYFYINNKKVVVKSHSPTFKVEFHKGVKGVYNSVSDFEKIGVSIEHRIHTGRFGNLKYKAQIQKMLSFNSGTLIDYHHIQSSGIMLYDKNPIDNVFLLEYYELDNSNYFIQIDIENDYNSLITSKLPFLKKFKCSFNTEFHQVFTPTAQYSEVAFGLNRIFKRIKFSYALGMLNGNANSMIPIDGYKNKTGKFRHGIRVGIFLDAKNRL